MEKHFCEFEIFGELVFCPICGELADGAVMAP